MKRKQYRIRHWSPKIIAPMEWTDWQDYDPTAYTIHCLEKAREGVDFDVEFREFEE